METNTNIQIRSNPIGELLKANTTLVVWLIFLAIGGGLLALYYARIGYLPDIEWSSSIVYLAAALVIGGGVGLLLALSVLLPGFIWSESLIHDPSLVKMFCYDEEGHEPCLRSIFYRLGVPFLLVLSASHIALLIGVLGYIVCAAVLLIVTFFLMRRRFESFLKRSSRPQTETAKDPAERRTFMYSAWFTLSVLLSQISMLVMYRLSGRPRGWLFIELTVICITGVLISNHVVAVRYHHSPRQAVAGTLVAAALLLFAADQFSPLSLRVMSHFGLGGDPKVDVLVNDEGSSIIEKLGLPNNCPQATKDRVCGIEVLSKVGKEYFFSLNGKTFTLPKSDVLSISSKDRRRQ
jgi:hypothetical protein